MEEVCSISHTSDGSDGRWGRWKRRNEKGFVSWYHSIVQELYFEFEYLAIVIFGLGWTHRVHSGYQPGV
jgi:hypothetical protein